MSDGFAPPVDLRVIGDGRGELRTVLLGSVMGDMVSLIELVEDEAGEPAIKATFGGFEPNAEGLEQAVELLEYVVALMKDQLEAGIPGSEPTA